MRVINRRAGTLNSWGGSTTGNSLFLQPEIFPQIWVTLSFSFHEFDDDDAPEGNADPIRADLGWNAAILELVADWAEDFAG